LLSSSRISHKYHPQYVRAPSCPLSYHHIPYSSNTSRILLVLLVLIPIPQYIRIIGQKSEFLFLNPAKGLVPHAHFILSAAYQALFLACVLYISSLSEGPIECCRSRGLYGPDEQGNGDRHLKGWNAFGVLLGVVQVAVLFLGTLLRCIYFFTFISPLMARFASPNFFEISA
jgi:hypothetical protein